MVNADPARTPTFAMFAKPDYFLVHRRGHLHARRASRQNTGFAWDHGDYAAEINTNYLGFAGPGVKHLGLDGHGAGHRPELGRAEQRPDDRGRQRHHRAPGSTRPTSGRP